MKTDLIASTQEYRDLVNRVDPRPTQWSEIVGNTTAVELIKESLASASKDRVPMPHTLLFAPPGTGKTTLAKLIARGQGGAITTTTGNTLETLKDLFLILANLNWDYEATDPRRFCTLFIDEIHALVKGTATRQAIPEESLFTVLESWVLHHNLVGKDIVDTTRGITLTPFNPVQPVYPFCTVGATTEPGMLSAPLLSRFPLQIQLEPYTDAEITTIILQASQRLKWPTAEPAAIELSKVSRQNPRNSVNLLRMAWSRARATDRLGITLDVAQEVIGRLNLYPLGLTTTDVAVLTLLQARAPRGAGQTEIANTVRISVSTFNGIVEPYLRQLGFIETLSRRSITAAGTSYLATIGKLRERNTA